MDEIKLKKIQKRADEGFSLLLEGEYEQALKIAKELQQEKYTAAFDIGAQAYVGLGNITQAIALLKEGLEFAPDSWLNWQLLGNYLSDNNDLVPAQDAYQRALECTDVWAESVFLNQAILFNRLNEFSSALALTSKIKDNQLNLHKIEVKVTALSGLNSIDEAIALADKVLSNEDYPEESEEIVGRIAAKLGEMHLKQGKPKAQIRAFALHSLTYNPNNEMLLGLIRDIDNHYSDIASYYQVFIHCSVPASSPSYAEIKGFYCNYDVIAESTNDVIRYIKSFEENMIVDGEYTIDEYEILEEKAEDPCGVYFVSGKSFYDNDE